MLSLRSTWGWCFLAHELGLEFVLWIFLESTWNPLHAAEARHTRRDNKVIWVERKLSRWKLAHSSNGRWKNEKELNRWKELHAPHSVRIIFKFCQTVMVWIPVQVYKFVNFSLSIMRESKWVTHYSNLVHLEGKGVGKCKAYRCKSSLDYYMGAIHKYLGDLNSMTNSIWKRNLIC